MLHFQKFEKTILVNSEDKNYARTAIIFLEKICSQLTRFIYRGDMDTLATEIVFRSKNTFEMT
jgi:hypothetical protein